MPSPSEPDWYLQDWLRHFQKRQASLVNELGWPKGRAFDVWHSSQPYKRDIVNQVARWLEIEPYELLMPPREALAIRKLRDSFLAIAAEEGAPFDRSGAPEHEPRSGD